MSDTTPRPPGRFPLPPEVGEIAATLEEAGFETWCVGGALRDHLLGDSRSDVDLATAATPADVQRLFRRTVPVGIAHGTVGVLDRSRRLHEVTTFRRDVATDGRHAVVAFGASLEEDLARRDFTINALAYHPRREEWRDPHGGLADLRAGVLRAVGDPAARFREDYLRVLRALRFAARFGFRIDPATWTGLREAVPGLQGLSAERVRDEWLKGLASARDVVAFVRLWHESGAAAVILPGLLDVPPLADADPQPRDPILLSALLIEDGCHALERLRASSEEVQRICRLAGGPLDPDGADPASVRRWMHEAGPAVDDLLAAHRLRHGTSAPWAATVSGIRARGEPVDRGGLAVDGGDLIAAGIPPGPGMGRILGQLLEAVLEEPGRNTRDWLLARAKELA